MASTSTPKHGSEAKQTSTLTKTRQQLKHSLRYHQNKNYQQASAIYDIMKRHLPRAFSYPLDHLRNHSGTGSLVRSGRRRNNLPTHYDFDFLMDVDRRRQSMDEEVRKEYEEKTKKFDAVTTSKHYKVPPTNPTAATSFALSRLPAELRQEVYGAIQKAEPRAIVLQSYEAYHDEVTDLRALLAPLNRRASLPACLRMSAEARHEYLRRARFSGGHYRGMFARVLPGSTGLMDSLGLPPTASVSLTLVPLSATLETDLCAGGCLAMLPVVAYTEVRQQTLAYGARLYFGESDFPADDMKPPLHSGLLQLGNAVCQVLERAEAPLTAGQIFHHAVLRDESWSSLTAFYYEYLGREPPPPPPRLPRPSRKQQPWRRRWERDTLRFLVNQQMPPTTVPLDAEMWAPLSRPLHEPYWLVRTRNTEAPVMQQFLELFDQLHTVDDGSNEATQDQEPQQQQQPQQELQEQPIDVSDLESSDSEAEENSEADTGQQQRKRTRRRRTQGQHRKRKTVRQRVRQRGIAEAWEESADGPSQTKHELVRRTTEAQAARKNALFPDLDAACEPAPASEVDGWRNQLCQFLASVWEDPIAQPLRVPGKPQTPAYLTYHDYQYVDPTLDLVVVPACLSQAQCWWGFRNQFLRSDREAVRRLALLVPQVRRGELNVWDSITFQFPNIEELVYVLNGPAVAGLESMSHRRWHWNGRTHEADLVYGFAAMHARTEDNQWPNFGNLYFLRELPFAGGVMETYYRRFSRFLDMAYGEANNDDDGSNDGSDDGSDDGNSEDGSDNDADDDEAGGIFNDNNDDAASDASFATALETQVPPNSVFQLDADLAVGEEAADEAAVHAAAIAAAPSPAAAEYLTALNEYHLIHHPNRYLQRGDEMDLGSLPLAPCEGCLVDTREEVIDGPDPATRDWAVLRIDRWAAAPVPGTRHPAVCRELVPKQINDMAFAQWKARPTIFRPAPFTRDEQEARGRDPHAVDAEPERGRRGGQDIPLRKITYAYMAPKILNPEPGVPLYVQYNRQCFAGVDVLGPGDVLVG